jgi:flagellin
MRIQNNVPALNAHRYYGINQAGVTKSIAKLSSGYRINSAADDAAGLAISEKMRAQIRGLTMASKNSQDGMSLIQTAEGGLQEIDNMLQRIRELVVYASNDTQDQANPTATQGDRKKIQDEINALVEEIDSMSDRVEFNKKKVISGAFMGGTDTQQKAYIKEARRFAEAKQALIEFVGGSTWTEGVANLFVEAEKNDIKYAATPTEAVSVDTVSGVIKQFESLFSDILTTTGGAALASGGEVYKKLMALQSGLPPILTSGTLSVAFASFASAVGVDSGSITGFIGAYNGLAAAVSSGGLDGTRAAVENSKVGGLYFQVGANANQGIEVKIGAANTALLGIGDGNGKSYIDTLHSTGKQITYQLDVLDTALSYITSERSKLGAIQNRLEYTQASLDISTENLTNAESRIRDVDMAKEMTQFTKMNILFQASTAMLAQANALPQGVLQMLG